MSLMSSAASSSSILVAVKSTCALVVGLRNAISNSSPIVTSSWTIVDVVVIDGGVVAAVAAGSGVSLASDVVRVSCAVAVMSVDADCGSVDVTACSAFRFVVVTTLIVSAPGVRVSCDWIAAGAGSRSEMVAWTICSIAALYSGHFLSMSLPSRHSGFGILATTMRWLLYLCWPMVTVVRISPSTSRSPLAVSNWCGQR